MKISDAAVFRRFWYPVVPEAMLAAGPRPFSLFGEDMVLWRGGDGAVSALRDECSHQAVRLSLGCVRGNRLVCPQHHWEFERDGRCARIPQRPELLPPPGTRVRSYQAARRYGLVWVTVEEALAPIPEIPEMEAPGFRVVHTLHERWKVSLPRFAENWMDSHPDARSDVTNGPHPSAEAAGAGMFRITSRSGATSGTTGPHCTATWWVPNCRGLHILHPNGLRQVILTAATPLSDRWTIVTRLQARSDTEADLPAAEVIAADRAIAAAERQRLEEFPADVPLMPGEAPDHDRPLTAASRIARERLRRMIEANA